MIRRIDKKQRGTDMFLSAYAAAQQLFRASLDEAGEALPTLNQEMIIFLE